MGVLSLTHRTGLGWSQSALRDWLPRLADQLGTVQELVDVRRRHTRDMRQGQALLDAVQRLQGHSTGDGLARALCETALEVSGARAAALVRWSAEGDGGELVFATEGTGLRAPAPLDGASVVGEACRAGKLPGPRGHPDVSARTRHLRGAARDPGARLRGDRPARAG